MAAGRHGLTLLELLVVVGIMLLVAAMGAGVWFNAAGTSRLAASERLLAGLVRQARHAARTSGQPVSLAIAGAAAPDPGQVAGTTGSVLWQEACEGAAPPFSLAAQAGSAADPAAWLTRGWTGQGLRIAGDLAAAPTGPLLDDAGAPLELIRTRRLIGRSSLRDGVLAGLRVELPDPAAAGGDLVPLLLVSTGTVANGALPEDGGAVLGLLLHRRAASFFASGTSPAFIGAPPASTSTLLWDVVAWVRIAGGGGPILVSAVADNLALGASLAPAASAADLAPALRAHGLGGGWRELALSWDGSSLDLLIDGVVAARRAAGGTRLDAGDGQPPRLWLGAAAIADPLRSYPVAATGLPSDPAAMPQGWRVDDLRLIALGTGLAGHLPSGIAPEGDRIITCQPDGRLTVDGVEGEHPILLRGAFDRRDETVAMTIHADGTVSSTRAAAR